MSTKDIIAFCRHCKGREDEPALPGCKRPDTHPNNPNGKEE